MNPPSLLVGMLSGTATMENSKEVSQKIKNSITTQPRNTSYGYLHPKIENVYLQRYIYASPYGFITALFMVARWKQPKYPLIDDWVKKMWYKYTMEYHLVIRKDKILPFTTT